MKDKNNPVNLVNPVEKLLVGEQNVKGKKWIWIVGMILLIAAAAYIGLNRLSNRQVEAPQTGEIVTVFLGDLSANATASGQVLVRREADLALGVSGQVAAVHVQVGDEVSEGDLLLALETTEWERAVESARHALIIQESNLATLLAPALAADVVAAQASVASAQANLDDLLDGPNQDEIAAAEADVRAAQGDVAAASSRLNALVAGANQEEIRAAEIELELAQQSATQAAEQHSTILVTEPSRFLSAGRLEEMEFAARMAAVQSNADLAAAQETLDGLLYGDSDAIAAAQASVALSAAQRDASQAQLALLLSGSSEAQIAAAESSLAQAKANLDKLLRGPSESQIAAAEIAVEQANISLQRAENNLTKATLTAPFDGVVTAVHVSPGEQTAGVLIEMMDTNSLEVALEVDEVDVGKIAVGQLAVITLEAWPEVEIEGQVASIAPRSIANNSAIVSYQVYLSFGETDLPLLVGMTANADLMVASRQDVLLVPNAAINADRVSNSYSVNRVENQTIEEVEITIGLRDGNYTQITGGLQAGDQVMVGNAIPVREFGPGRGGPFGGG